MSPSLLQPDSPTATAFRKAARDQKCVFFSGLPGMGKTLMMQQFLLIAAAEGRSVQLLQWDVVRERFEVGPVAIRYPEVSGVTHPGIRKAVGHWARGRVARWHREFPGDADLLVGEAPLIGNRLADLAREGADEAEALLRGGRTTFFVPAPTAEVRREIERSRERETLRPRHERERANAAPALLGKLWTEIAEMAVHFGLSPEREAATGGYQQQLYGAVYERVLRHRNAVVLPVAEILPVTASPHDLHPGAREITPTPAEIEEAFAVVDRLSLDELRQETAQWFHGAAASPSRAAGA
ncbi:hypothetical protein [Streptomyces sp. NPDC101393]|uniref:hypothetical protein n=1 Tax=Streptomyces sp. NPDC101393 TaxID=3366141 RepID=UPI0037F67ABA